MTIKDRLLSILNELKGSGKFISKGSADFIFPGLIVEGVDELSYPISQSLAKSLIKIAQKAPFGMGTETILDDKVRKGWEIEAHKLKFEGNRWEKLLERILKQIKPELGLEDYTISAKLYKMLIYENGDFFLPHKDTEKEKGMFGTLVIGLPSKHTGGELVVSFEGKEEIVKLEGKDTIDFAAFYADCDHEVKPVTSGYRICLVYNLVQEKAVKSIFPASISLYSDQLSKALSGIKSNFDTKPLIILLRHQYTPENFSREALKLNDRLKAAVLLQAAEKADWYAKLCLVTSYKMGTPAYTGGYYNDNTDDDAVMEEIYDESLNIEHWVESKIPKLSELELEEDDLITSFSLDEDEPIEKENTGYMGNYGPDLMHCNRLDYLPK